MRVDDEGHKNNIIKYLKNRLMREINKNDKDTIYNTDGNDNDTTDTHTNDHRTRCILPNGNDDCNPHQEN